MLRYLVHQFLLHFFLFRVVLSSSLSGFLFKLSAIDAASAKHQCLGQYPPFLFTLCSLDATNIKIKGTFRLLNELFLSFSLTLYNVDCLLVKFCAI